MAVDPRTDPHAHFVTTPLPSQVRAAKAAKAAETTKALAVGVAGAEGAVGSVSASALAGCSAVSRFAAPTAPAASDDPFLRAENEDDDGYDPYSDRPAAPEPLFQEEPWA